MWGRFGESAQTAVQVPATSAEPVIDTPPTEDTDEIIDDDVATSSTIKLNKKKLTLRVGKTYKLKVKGTSKTVKWSSSNKKIAKVSSSGLVKAKKVGKATITAKVAGKTLKCKVTVKKKGSSSSSSSSSRSSASSSSTIHKTYSAASSSASTGKGDGKKSHHVSIQTGDMGQNNNRLLFGLSGIGMMLMAGLMFVSRKLMFFKRR